MKKSSNSFLGHSKSARSSSRDPLRTVGRNLEAFLLLELLRKPSYGYDLMNRLAHYGFKRAKEPGVVYKLLRSMEESGAIRSKWSPQESGPARRYYKLTNDGRALLHHRAYQLKRQMARTQRLLEDYVKLTHDTLTAEPASGVFQQNSGTAGAKENAHGP